MLYLFKCSTDLKPSSYEIFISFVVTSFCKSTQDRFFDAPTCQKLELVALSFSALGGVEDEHFNPKLKITCCAFVCPDFKFSPSCRRPAAVPATSILLGVFPGIKAFILFSQIGFPL